jgi:hypothetical protein
MNRKDIQKSVWDRAFDDLDEEGNPIEQSRKIKTDGEVNRNRSNRLRLINPILEKQRIEALQEVMKTTEWKEKQKENGAIISSKYISDMDKRKKALKEGWNKPGVREAKSLSAKEAANRPEVKEKALKHILERAKKQMVPIVTREGIFSCAQEWATFVKKDKAMFGYWAKKFPNEYYRISQEEYILLTGNDPF